MYFLNFLISGFKWFRICPLRIWKSTKLKAEINSCLEYLGVTSVFSWGAFQVKSLAGQKVSRNRKNS